MARLDNELGRDDEEDRSFFGKDDHHLKDFFNAFFGELVCLAIAVAGVLVWLSSCRRRGITAPRTTTGVSRRLGSLRQEPQEAKSNRRI